jgi:hypothetical protein
MKVQEVVCNRASYLIDNINADKTTYTYKIINADIIDREPLFTQYIRIEKDNGFHERSRYFDYWLYFRNDTNWKRCSKTGLVQKSITGLCEGNISRTGFIRAKNEKGKEYETPQHLVIVQAPNKDQEVTVDIYNNFYIPSKSILNVFLKERYGITKKGAK